MLPTRFWLIVGTALLGATRTRFADIFAAEVRRSDRRESMKFARTTASGLPRPNGNHIRKNRSVSPVCQAPFEKRFWLSPTPNHQQTMLILSRQKGRFANVSNAGQDAMDAGGFLDE
jgi:hypothetical protein